MAQVPEIKAENNIFIDNNNNNFIYQDNLH